MLALAPTRFAFPFVLLAFLAGCAAPPPHPTYPDIRFTGEPPLRIDVASIEVRSDYQPTYRAPDVEHLFPVPPQRAAENWAHDRLVASGAAGRARFTIRNARVVEVELKKKSEGITGALTKEPAQRYDLTLDVRLDVLDERGLPVRTVTVTSTRSQTVLEGATPNEREQTWYDMVKATMADFDRQMTTEIRGNFGRYLVLQ